MKHPTSRRILWGRRARRIITGAARRIVSLDDTPRSIALGGAIGMVVSMTPTYGIQILIVLLINSMLRVNRVAGAITIQITNPITLIPAYWADYKVGAAILGSDPISQEQFKGVLRGLESTPFIESMRNIFSLGWGIFLPMLVGSLILGGILGVASYPVFLISVKRYKEKRALRRARRKLRSSEQKAEAERRDDAAHEPPASPSGTQEGSEAQPVARKDLTDEKGRGGTG